MKIRHYNPPKLLQLQWTFHCFIVCPHNQRSWWLRQQRIYLQFRRPGFDPWVGKIPWRREWLPTTHSRIPAWRIPWTEEPDRLSPWGCKESGMTEQLTLSFPFHNQLIKETQGSSSSPVYQLSLWKHVLAPSPFPFLTSFPHFWILSTMWQEP